MGTCCRAHLAAKVRDYALNAENGAVTVKPIENPPYGGICDYIVAYTDSDGTSAQGSEPIYCGAPAEFALSFFSKKNPDDDPTQPDSSLRREMKERK